MDSISTVEAYDAAASELDTIGKFCAFLVTDCAFNPELSHAAAEAFFIASTARQALAYPDGKDYSTCFVQLDMDAALKTLREQWKIANLVEKRAKVGLVGSAITVPAALRVCAAITALAKQVQACKQLLAAIAC